jgi:hypothetical protein
MTFFLGWIAGWIFLILISILSVSSAFFVRLSSMVWPLFWVIPHPHIWRKLTSKTDYGAAFSRHWGEYHGVKEKECTLCGKVEDIR